MTFSPCLTPAWIVRAAGLRDLSVSRLTPPPPLLTADDIPFDWPTSQPIPYEYQAPVKPFEHTPTVTYRSGDKTIVVTGPIEPTIPHMTEATRAGWEKWYGDRADHIDAAIEACRQRAAKRKAYFKLRKDKKDADWDAKCVRARARENRCRQRPKYREPPPDLMYYVKDEKLVAMVNEFLRCRSVAERMREYRHPAAFRSPAARASPSRNPSSMRMERRLPRCGAGKARSRSPVQQRAAARPA